MTVRRHTRTVMLLAGASAVIGLAGCRHMDGHARTGSIKDSPVAVASEPAKAKPARKPVRKVASVAKPAAGPSSGVASAATLPPASKAPAPAAKAVAPAKAAAATPAPAAPKPDRGPVEIVLDECRALMAKGDVVAARARAESAMTKARSPYLLWLAHTYDPAFLGKVKNANAKPDIARATALYKEAVQLGSVDAERDLKAMTAKR